MKSIGYIVTFYNKGDHLFKTLESISKCIRENDKVVVVDDFSDDPLSIEHFKYCQQYKWSFNIRFFRTSKNLGCGGAKQFGINKINVDFILTVDADDFLIQDGVQYSLNIIENNDFDIFFSDYLLVNVETTEQVRVSMKDVVYKDNLLPRKLSKNWIILGASFIKLSKFREIGGFDTSLRAFEDYVLLKGLFLNNATNKYIGRCYYCWNKSTGGNNSSYSYRESAKAFFKYREFESRNLPFVIYCYRYLKNLIKFII